MSLGLEEAVKSSVSYLVSPEATESLARDPYWPKWASPWWHLLALEEAGRTASIPPEVPRAMLDALRHFYLPFFLRSAAELPPG